MIRVGALRDDRNELEDEFEEISRLIAAEIRAVFVDADDDSVEEAANNAASSTQDVIHSYDGTYPYSTSTDGSERVAFVVQSVLDASADVALLLDAQRKQLAYRITEALAEHGLAPAGDDDDDDLD